MIVFQARGMRTSDALRIAFIAFLLGGGGATGVAHAQSVPAAAGTVEGLDIVVTARKRQENLRDVPDSVTALSAQALTTAKINEMTDLTSNVPTVVVATGTVAPYVFLRGFGSGGNVSLEQSVGKFVDNVSLGRDQDVRIPLFDLDRVEVLKGPQVLLYGNSATAGAFNITTTKPGSSLTGDIATSYEFRAHEVVTQGGLTVPVNDQLSMRVSGYFGDLAHGRVYNATTGDNEPTDRNWAARGLIRYKPRTGVEVLLKAEYDHLRTYGEATEVAYPPYIGTLPDTSLNNVREGNTNVAPLYAADFTGLNAALYQGDVNLDILGGTLNSTTAYRDTRSVLQGQGQEPVPPLDVYVLTKYHQFSQELRYARTFAKLDLLAGGYYQSDKVNNTNSLDVAFLNAALISTGDQTRKSYSVFAEATYHATDALSLAAGARNTWVNTDGILFSTVGAITPGKTFGTERDALLTPASIAAGRTLDPRITENHFQPQVITQYKFADKNQIYVKYVKGAKAGGIDSSYRGNIAEDSTFKSEEAQSWETGIKGIVAGNTLDYSLVAFSETFTNLQLSTFENNQFRVSNVGKARTRGIELELNWRPVSKLLVNLTGDYLDARFIDFSGGTCNREQIEDTAAIRGAQPCRTGSFGVPTLAGVATPYSSRWTSAFRLTYDAPIGNNLVLSANTAVLGRSGYFSDTNNEPDLYQHGYVLLDASLDLHQRYGGFSVGLFAKDLTNKQYIESGGTVQGGLTTGALFAQLSRGRQLGIRAGYKF